MILMKIYKQKLREIWLQMPEFKDWLIKDPENTYRAYCSYCRSGMNTKLSDLRAHARSKKHINGCDRVKKPNNLCDAEDEAGGPSSNCLSEFIRPHTKREKDKINYNGSELHESMQDVFSKNTKIEVWSQPWSCSVVPNSNELPLDVKKDSQASTQLDTMDPELISKAAAIINHKSDSAQVFGDFVADRLRQLTTITAESTKDKIMEVLLEASSLNRLHAN